MNRRYKADIIFILLVLIIITICLSCSFTRRFDRQLKKAVAMGLVDTLPRNGTGIIPLAADSCKDDSIVNEVANDVIDQYAGLTESVTNNVIKEPEYHALSDSAKKKKVDSAIRKEKQKAKKELSKKLKDEVLLPARMHAFKGVHHFASPDSSVKITAWQKENGDIAINWDYYGVRIVNCLERTWFQRNITDVLIYYAIGFLIGVVLILIIINYLKGARGGGVG